MALECSVVQGWRDVSRCCSTAACRWLAARTRWRLRCVCVLKRVHVRRVHWDVFSLTAARVLGVRSGRTEAWRANAEAQDSHLEGSCLAQEFFALSWLGCSECESFREGTKGAVVLAFGAGGRDITRTTACSGPL